MSEGAPGSKRPEQGYDLHFEKIQHKPGVDTYVFNKVAVAVDFTKKNFAHFPEILFGTFDSSIHDVDLLSQPETRREGVDMEYVRACLEKVAEVTGIHEFQFAPFGEDGHEAARLRLFKRYLSIRESPDGQGYIVDL